MMPRGKTTFPMMFRKGGVRKKNCKSRDALGGPREGDRTGRHMLRLRSPETDIEKPKVQYETGESSFRGQKAKVMPCHLGQGTVMEKGTLRGVMSRVD